MPSCFAAQSRQRYGGSIAGRKRLPAICASCSAICSMSSRNLRNMIQVSIGSRSRSPLSPLSLRMMSRQDFTMDESRCAVVRGCAFFCVRAIFDNLKLQISNLKRKKDDTGISDLRFQSTLPNKISNFRSQILKQKR